MWRKGRTVLASDGNGNMTAQGRHWYCRVKGSNIFHVGGLEHISRGRAKLFQMAVDCRYGFWGIRGWLFVAIGKCVIDEAVGDFFPSRIYG